MLAVLGDSGHLVVYAILLTGVLARAHPSSRLPAAAPGAEAPTRRELPDDRVEANLARGAAVPEAAVHIHLPCRLLPGEPPAVSGCMYAEVFAGQLADGLNTTGGDVRETATKDADHPHTQARSSAFARTPSSRSRSSRTPTSASRKRSRPPQGAQSPVVPRVRTAEPRPDSTLGFWYIQRYWKIRTKPMFVVTNVVSVLIPLWGASRARAVARRGGR
jgi:hypothetical protein